jgi:hypothetical protein
MVGSICKYGNLHIRTANKKADAFFRKVLDQTNFEYLVAGSCGDKYYKSGAIKGRRMIV